MKLFNLLTVTSNNILGGVSGINTDEIIQALFYLLVIIIGLLLIRFIIKKFVKKDNNNTPSNESEIEQNSTSAEKKSCLWSFLKFASISIAIIFVLLTVSSYIQTCDKDTNNKPQILERAATTKDIDIDTTYGFPTYIVLYLTPAVDIDDLVIKIEYLDSDNNKIDTGYADFGNVKENKLYKKEISILGISSPFSVNSAHFTIYAGTVSLI